MDEKPKYEYLESELIKRIVRYQSSCRLVLVEAWAWDDEEGDHADARIYQVLALESRLVHVFVKRVTAEYAETHSPYCGHSAKDFSDAGYYLSEEDLREGVVVLGDEFNEPLSTVDRWAWDTSSPTRLVECMWPASEDNERLNDVIAQLCGDAMNILAGRRQQQVTT